MKVESTGQHGVPILEMTKTSLRQKKRQYLEKQAILTELNST